MGEKDEETLRDQMSQISSQLRTEYIRTRNKARLVAWCIMGVCVVGLGLAFLSLAIDFGGFLGG